MTNVNKQYDILIVGGGLVGVVLAAAIVNNPANKSVSIALIEKSNAPQRTQSIGTIEDFDSRVVALSHTSIELLKELNVWNEIEKQRVCPYLSMQVWDDEGTGSIEFNAEDLAQDNLGVIVENRIVLCALLDIIESSDQIEVLRGREVTAFTKKNSKQYVTLDNHSIIESHLLIAADGGNSKIRELSGLTTRSWDYNHKAIVTIVKTEESHQFTAWQNFRSTGPLAFLPIDHASEKFCSIVWSIENDKADELMAMSDADFCVAVGDAFQCKLGKVELISTRYCFPLKQRHAKDYIEQQLALVGDAAHTIHPLAGQGVNIGLLDAKALADEISRASSRGLDLSDNSILRRYQRQRKKHNVEVMLLMEAFKRLFGSRRLDLRWLRNSGLKTLDAVKPVKNWLAKQAMGL